MKIAFLNMYNGLVDRGAETFVKEVAERLAKDNEVFVFQAGDKTDDEKYKVIKIPVNINWNRKTGAGTFLSRMFLDYWSLKILVFTLKSLGKIWKEKYDIVIPVNGGWMPAFVRIVTWLYGGKMVISGQAGVGWDEANNLWSFPNVFVPLSEKAKHWARKVNPLISLKKISNGVDIKKFKPKGSRVETKLKNPIILCVGALTSSKRIDLVIDAVAKLKNISLLVAGDGEMKDELTKKGKKLLGDRFELISVPFEEMPKVYRVADLFTLVSESYYAFEIVLVEAMATNLPVVANKDEIREEVVKDAGILVDPKDVSAYARSLKQALNKKWGDIPRKRAKSFDWDRVAKRYENLFESLIKKNK